ncbi:MAG: sigma-70 family RNA polymerase sigma factor [Oscillospiraceae bacterium]|nr:sigma-70 family RNA polymerase sigma factor [Oscillospiraceae bacterium]
MMEMVNVCMNENENEFESSGEVNNNFYIRYNPQIRAVVSRILIHANLRGEIDDCVNEVFLKLMERLQEYNEMRGTMGAFVTVIARSTALNYCRSGSRKSFELVGDEKLDILSSPLEYQNEAEYDLLVESIIAKLNKNERVLFTMRYLYYYTPEEIAKALKINRGAVDMRTNRLKSKIKTFLTRGGIII